VEKYKKIMILKYSEFNESNGLRLKYVCDIKTNFPEADFWLIRKGDEKTVGKPVEKFEPQYIGIKVLRTDILFPKYLYYIFVHLQESGQLIQYTKGVLNLKHIIIDDIKNIKI